jgi:hypothetical protein
VAAALVVMAPAVVPAAALLLLLNMPDCREVVLKLGMWEPPSDSRLGRAAPDTRDVWGTSLDLQHSPDGRRACTSTEAQQALLSPPATSNWPCMPPALRYSPDSSTKETTRAYEGSKSARAALTGWHTGSRTSKATRPHLLLAAVLLGTSPPVFDMALLSDPSAAAAPGLLCTPVPDPPPLLGPLNTPLCRAVLSRSAWRAAEACSRGCCAWLARRLLLLLRVLRAVRGGSGSEFSCSRARAAGSSAVRDDSDCTDTYRHTHTGTPQPHSIEPQGNTQVRMLATAVAM